jgi:hypothetical protein
MKAFPTATRVDKESYDTGMDLRDYFAASVMQGLMASQWQVDEPYSVYCYKIADEMIKAREE